MDANQAIEKYLIETLGNSQLIIAKQVGAITELQNHLEASHKKVEELEAKLKEVPVTPES